jgi:hypothetical protein
VPAECQRYVEQSCCFRPLQALGGFVPVQDKALVLPGLECAACVTAGAWVLSAAASVVLLMWQFVAAILHLIGERWFSWRTSCTLYLQPSYFDWPGIPPSATQLVEGGVAQLQSTVVWAWMSTVAVFTGCVQRVCSLCSGAGGEAGATESGVQVSAFNPTAVVRSMQGYAPVRQQEPGDPAAGIGSAADIEAGVGSRKGAPPRASPTVHFV